MSSRLQPLTHTHVAVLAASLLILGGWAPDRKSPLAGWTTLIRDDGSVARAYGAGIDAPGCVASASAATTMAARFLDENLDHIAPATRTADFTISANVEQRGMRVISFQQSTGGVPILGAGIALYCKADRLFVVALSVVANPARPVVAMVPPNAAGDTAAAHLSAARYVGAVTSSVDGPFVWERDTVYRAQVETQAPFGRFFVLVDAVTEAVLGVESRVRDADGTVLYRTPTRHPGDQPVDHAASLVGVTIDGMPSMTDDSGGVTWPTAVAATVGPSTVGSFVEVSDDLAGGPPPDLTLPPGGTAVWATPADPTLSAARIVYVHAAIARARAKLLAPSLAWLDDSLHATVNVASLCNAQSTGDDILFFRGGNNGVIDCVNPGAIVDMVYHEFAHSLHFQSVVPNVGDWDPALGEGLADYFAASMTGDPGWARGFLYGERPWRHIDPSWFEVVFPRDVQVGNPHATGRIISGALWDLRKQLVDDMGATAGRDHADALAYQVMRLSDSIVTAYVEVLAADDDDGDLTNGTPNQCAIDIAFARHGLGDAPVPVTPRPPTRDGHDVTLAIDGEPTACAPSEVASARIEWHERGEVTDMVVELIWVGDPDAELVASLPEIADDTVIEYRVIVAMTDGSERAFPDNRADPYYDAYFGPTQNIYCTGFTLADVVAEWEHDWNWSAPDGEHDSGDPRVAVSPTLVLGTYDGRGNDSGLYRANDSKSAKSPSIDTMGYPGVRLQYYRWLDVQDGHFDQARILANGAVVWSNFDSDLGDASDVHHQDREWRFHDIDLTDYIVEGHIQIELTLDSDASEQFGGWTIDSLCFVGTGQPVGGDDAGPGSADAAVAAASDAGDDDGYPGPGGCGCGAGAGSRGDWPTLALIALMIALVTGSAAGRRRG